jgi:predicted transposase/invertase (TIGR01784 family)
LTEAKRAKIIEIINHEEGIAMVAETLGTFTQEEIEYARQLSLLKGELDWQSGMAHAEDRGREEGLTEGLEKGRTEASLDIARKMRTIGFLVEQIQAVTGLSTETITQL